MKLETHKPFRPAGSTKEWSWSYSKYKNWVQCPKRMYEVDVLRRFQDTGGEALAWGNEVHAKMAEALKNNTPLPKEMQSYDYWVDRVRRGTGDLLVEQKYAITRDFQPVPYFDSRVWYRGIGDVVRLNNPVTYGGETFRAALVLDWKTGKVLEDSVQLMLMAQCLFSHFPDLTHVRSSFVWLKEDCETPELLTRQEVADQWVDLLPRIQAMEKAFTDNDFPPKPGYLCQKYCPVQSCPFWGKSNR